MPKKKLSQLVLQVSRHALQADGYRSRFIETPWGKVHYYRATGSGPLPVMVFLHGLGAHGADLTPLFRPLRRYSQGIVVVDLPVHGLSDTPKGGVTPYSLEAMFHAAMEKILAHDRPVLIFGNSLGGLAAIRFTNAHPDKVQALVLSSPGGAPVDPEKLQKLRDIFESASAERTAEFVERLYNRPPAYRRLMEEEIKMRFGKEELRQILAHFDPEHLLSPEELQAIQVPTLLIWGQQDRILEEHVEFYRTHKPGHFQLEEPAHFTHCPYMEMPEELAIRIRDFARVHCSRGGVA